MSPSAITASALPEHLVACLGIFQIWSGKYRGCQNSLIVANLASTAGGLVRRFEASRQIWPREKSQKRLEDPQIGLDWA